MATTDPSAVADTLDAAADLLWMYGRSHGLPVTDEGRHCILGAVTEARGLDPWSWAWLAFAETKAEHDALAAQIVTDGHDHRADCATVWAFNDRTPLTPEGDALVIDTVRRAAKTVRNSVSES
jgi:hypothetical protein